MLDLPDTTDPSQALAEAQSMLRQARALIRKQLDANDQFMRQLKITSNQLTMLEFMTTEQQPGLAAPSGIPSSIGPGLWSALEDLLSVQAELSEAEMHLREMRRTAMQDLREIEDLAMRFGYLELRQEV